LRKIIIFAMLPFVLITAFSIASVVEPDALEQLIKTKDVSVQREALHKIIRNKSSYSQKLKRKLESCYRRKGSYHEFKTLLYVAALIKCKETVPILEKIWLDQTSYENDCIYCCPRSLVMAVLNLHGVWNPPKLSVAQRRADQVENTLDDLKRCGNGSLETESQNGFDPQANDDFSILARQYSAFKNDKLLEIVTNSEYAYQQKYVASIELRKRAVDDHLLVDYYWWALNAFDDTSGECLCFAHESILLAELYNSKHKN
jgi:hypothetical protein